MRPEQKLSEKQEVELQSKKPIMEVQQRQREIELETKKATEAAEMKRLKNLSKMKIMEIMDQCSSSGSFSSMDFFNFHRAKSSRGPTHRRISLNLRWWKLLSRNLMPHNHVNNRGRSSRLTLN